MVPRTVGRAPGQVDIGSTSDVYATIYAPQSPVVLSGSGSIYGSVIGKSINMTGSSNIYYDLNYAGGVGVLQVVK